ncbi:MAG: hypothetical protein JST81_13290 [Bacteroidetes bacterium]|nr:hypothetical protein [Bacteroidota bacterium]
MMSLYDLPEKDIHDERLCFYDGFKIRSYSSEVIQHTIDNCLRYKLYNLKTLGPGYEAPAKITGHSLLNNCEDYKIDIEINKTPKGIPFVQFSGSFHKLFYCGKNYLPFRWSDFLHLSKLFQNEFKIEPIEAKVVCLENGINNDVSESSTDAKTIARNAQAYKGVRVTKSEHFDDRGYIKEFEQEDYSIKIYDKARQNGITDRSILRFERKIKNNRELVRTTGISSLADLEDYQKHTASILYTIQLFDHLILRQDELYQMKLDNKEREFINELATEKQWEDLHGFSTNKYKYNKSKYERLIEKYCLVNLKKFLKDKMLSSVQIGNNTELPIFAL